MNSQFAAPKVLIADDPPLQVRPRHCIRLDLPAMLAIDKDGYRNRWTSERFIRVLREPNAAGKVAECGATVAGFLVYEQHPDHYAVLRLAVHPKWRRRGVGKRLLADLVGKLKYSRPQILATVSERNLGGQLFLRELGFKCGAIAEDPDGIEDAYMFAYTLGGC